MNEFRMTLSASHGLGNGKTAHLEGLLEKSSTSSIDIEYYLASANQYKALDVTQYIV